MMPTTSFHIWSPNFKNKSLGSVLAMPHAYQFLSLLKFSPLLFYLCVCAHGYAHAMAHGVEVREQFAGMDSPPAIQVRGIQPRSSSLVAKPVPSEPSQGLQVSFLGFQDHGVRERKTSSPSSPVGRSCRYTWREENQRRMQWQRIPERWGSREVR